MARDIEILCPCCRERLWVDTETRRAWPSDKLKKKKAEEGRDAFEDALESVRRTPREAEDRFKKALDDEAHRDDKLDDAFRKAKEEADRSPDERPPNPLDWD